MSDRMPRASGYFRTDYAQEIALIKTRLERMSLIVLLALLWPAALALTLSRAGCTVGEICGVLRELWGTYDAHA